MRMTAGFWLLLMAPAAAGDLFPAAQSARIREGLHMIYNLDHDGAAAIFERMIAESPQDPAGYTYLATALWRRELSDKQGLSIDRFAASDFFSEQYRPLGRVDPAIETRFHKLSEEAIGKARGRLARSPGDRTSLFLLGLAYQNLASYEASLKRSWWAAFRDGSRAYGYHRDLLRSDPELHDAMLATGVCDYVTGNLGWSTRWLALLMGYRGGRDRGIQELETVARKGQLAADDARVMLVLIYTREHDYQRAYDTLDELHRRYPRNHLFTLDMAGLRLRMNQPQQAYQIYRDVLRGLAAAQYRNLEPAAVYNRLGVASRAMRDLSASARWFRTALAQPGVSVQAATLAHLELGKTLDAMGQPEQALAEYRAAATAPDVAGSKQEAERLMRHLPAGRMR